MRRTGLVGGLVAGAILSAGCGTHRVAETTNWRTVAVDPGALLTVRVVGAPQDNTPIDLSNRALEGQTTHRILRNQDGSVLFAYDLVMKKTADQKQFKLLLLPAANGGPTFANKREASARVDEDMVRVELMEQPQTHEKIVDVYRLQAPATVELQAESFSLIGLHNAVFRWLHGK